MSKSSIAPPKVPKRPEVRVVLPAGPLRTAERHRLSPGRGVVIGVLAGLMIWLALAWIFFKVL